MRFVGAIAISGSVWLLAACTPMQWVKPDTTAEQLHSDMSQCEQQAWHEASLRSWHYPRVPIVARDAQGRSFVIWPPAYFGDPFADRFFEELRLTNFCMRVKGYELVPSKPAK